MLTQQTFVLMKTSWRRNSSSSSEEGKSNRFALGKSNRFVLAMRLQDVFKTSSKRLEDVLQKHLLDIFKTSSRHLQDVLQRCLQDVFKTYHHVKLFLLTSLWDVFNTFLRCTSKRIIYRMICLQLFSKYIETFWCFTKFSFDYKWNDAGLLLTNTVYPSCLTSCRTTEDLGSYEIEKYQESV